MFFNKKKEQVDLDIDNIPNHIAFIMDGNGRWAKKRKMPVSFGHSKGVERIEDCIHVAKELKITNMTFYAFSTENWKRSDDEVGHLISLIYKFYEEKLPQLIKEDVRVKIIGSRKNIDAELNQLFDKIESESAHKKSCIVNIAFNYGSREELINAYNQLISEGKTKIDEEDIENHLYTSGQPDVDLLIRTSGEKRISNYLLWQISYAELIFNEKLWPEYTQEEFKKDILEYQNRNRRFGGR